MHLKRKSYIRVFVILFMTNADDNIYKLNNQMEMARADGNAAKYAAILDYLGQSPGNNDLYNEGLNDKNYKKEFEIADNIYGSSYPRSPSNNQTPNAQTSNYSSGLNQSGRPVSPVSTRGGYLKKLREWKKQAWIDLPKNFSRLKKDEMRELYYEKRKQVVKKKQ